MLLIAVIIVFIFVIEFNINIMINIFFLGTSLIVEYALLDVPVAMCAVYTELSSVCNKESAMVTKILTSAIIS